MGRPKLELLARNGVATFVMPYSITLRPRSHYGENHDDGDGNVYGDGRKRGESVTHKTFLSS